MRLFKKHKQNKHKKMGPTLFLVPFLISQTIFFLTLLHIFVELAQY